MIGALLLAASAPLPARPVPVRIASNNPCIDAILAELVPADRVIAVSSYSHDPRSASVDLRWARRFRAIGNTAEEVISVKPDLLLTGSPVPIATGMAVRRSGIRTIEIGVPQTIAESRAQIAQIAQAVGAQAAGTRLIARIDASIKRAARSDAPVPVLIRMGGGLVPGNGTFPDELLRRAGFANVGATYGVRGWGIAPLEVVLRRPPALVLMPAGSAPDIRASHRALATLRGTRSAIFPESMLFCGGPTIIQAMSWLANTRRRIG